jgi:hypothetical protein
MAYVQYISQIPVATWKIPTRRIVLQNQNSLNTVPSPRKDSAIYHSSRVSIGKVRRFFVSQP